MECVFPEVSAQSGVPTPGWVDPRLTDRAYTHFKALLEEEAEPGLGFRISVDRVRGVPPAVSVAFCPKAAAQPSDQVRVYPDFTVYIEQSSVPVLVDARIDYEPHALDAQITVYAPHLATVDPEAPSADSPLFDRVAFFIENVINPALAEHRGSAALVAVTHDGVAQIQFSGGCKGCSMTGTTLKAGIAPRVLAEFPELRAVEEATGIVAGDGG